MSEHVQATAGTGHDVVIVGGGLVGASLAIALSRIGVDVALVEATPAGALPAVFDQRNLSFAEATVHALTALGVMQRLALPPAPIRSIHVSRAGDFGRVRLQASEHGRDAFGQVVVASDFGAALESVLAGAKGLARYRPARFIGFAGKVDAGSEMRILRLALADGREQRVGARLVVAADGAHSAVRTALGVAAEIHDYGHDLFVARMRSRHAPDGDAWERFGEHGPTALLPRGDGHYGVVHGVPREEADAVAALDDAGWIARIQRAFGWRVGEFTGAGARSRYPAMRLVASSLSAPRAVLVGNAAQSLHPVGAQGFNLGLRDALTLAELLEQGGDPGNELLLAEYASRREEDRRRTLEFSHGLALATMQPAALARPLRSAGMLAASRAPSLQGWLVGGAMGYRGVVPRLCRAPATDSTAP